MASGTSYNTQTNKVIGQNYGNSSGSGGSTFLTTESATLKPSGDRSATDSDSAGSTTPLLPRQGHCAMATGDGAVLVENPGGNSAHLDPGAMDVDRHALLYGSHSHIFSAVSCSEQDGQQARSRVADTTVHIRVSGVSKTNTDNERSVELQDGSMQEETDDGSGDDEALRNHNLAAAKHGEQAQSLQRQQAAVAAAEQERYHKMQLLDRKTGAPSFLAAADTAARHASHVEAPDSSNGDTDMTAEEVLQAAMLEDYETDLPDHHHDSNHLHEHSYGDDAPEPHPDDEDYHPNPVFLTHDVVGAHRHKRPLEEYSPNTTGHHHHHYDHYETEQFDGGMDQHGTFFSQLHSRHQDPLAVTKKMRAMLHSDDDGGMAAATAYEYDNPGRYGGPLTPAESKKVNNEQWDTMFEKLKVYKAHFGDCLVPKRYAADPRLGTWVETQRVQYKRLPRVIADAATGQEVVQPNKRLNAARLAKLEAIGFAWSAKHVRKSNTSKNGSKPLSPSTVPGAEDPVASRGGGGTELGPLGLSSHSQAFPSQPRRPRLNETQWEDMYQRLVHYKSEHGDCLVPRKYDKDPKLAVWVETQRALWNRDYRKTAPAASSPAPLQAGEQPPYMPPVDMQAEAVDIPVAPPIGLPLGNYPQQSLLLDDRNNKAKRLTPERKLKLDEIGFVWSLRSKRIEDHWDQMFRQLLAYKEQHGDCLVPSRYEANLKLGKWVETQRYEYTKLLRASTGASGAAEAQAPPADSNYTEGDFEAGIASKLEVDGASAAAGTASAATVKGRPTNPRLTEERLRRLESIGFEWKVKHKMKRYYDKQWDSMFDRLKAFKEVNGHCMVPKRFPADPRLGTWVHTQRIQYRKLKAGPKKVLLTEEDLSAMKSCGEEATYRLTDERRQRLESIGFIWSAREGEKGTEPGRIIRNSYDDQWDSMFEKLKLYKEKYGNCLVPKRYKENPRLGTWCDTQRVQYKKLQKKLAEQGKQYEAGVTVIGDELMAAQDTSGNTSPTTAPGVSPKPLVGRLTDDRICRLQKLGFVWSLRDDWQKHYDELKAYKAIHGHCNVPARYAENRRLGIWVSAQRQQHKTMHQLSDAARARRSAPLTQERIELLNQLGFTWTIRSRDTLGESWNLRLEELKDFKAKHGHCLVPSRYAASPELGVWVGTQRTQYRLYMKSKETGIPVPGAAAMNEDRIAELNELGFAWALRGSDSRNDRASLPVCQQHGEVIYDGDGYVAAHVLQVMQASGQGGASRSPQSAMAGQGHGPIDEYDSVGTSPSPSDLVAI